VPLSGCSPLVVVLVVGLIVASGFSVEEEGAPAGDRYCSAEKEDELAALQLSSGDAIKPAPVAPLCYHLRP
jgi:hypothetical protein